MTFILFFVYYFAGIALAAIAASAIGFSIASVIGLFSLFGNIKRAINLLIYLLGMCFCGGLVIAILFACGWLGDMTHQQGQTGVLVGAIFPGIISLAIIPAFIQIAIKQVTESALPD